MELHFTYSVVNFLILEEISSQELLFAPCI
jgi:hypothetical protein